MCALVHAKNKKSGMKRLSILAYEAVESVVQPNLHKAVFFLHSWFVLGLFLLRCVYYVSYTSFWDIPETYVRMVLIFTMFGIVKDLWKCFLEKVAGLPLFKRYVASYDEHKEEIQHFWRTHFRWIPWVFGLGYGLAGVFICFLAVEDMARFVIESDLNHYRYLMLEERVQVEPVSLYCVLPGVQALAGVGVGHFTARSTALVFCASPMEAKVGSMGKGAYDWVQKYGGLVGALLVGGTGALCSAYKIIEIDSGLNDHSDPSTQRYQRMLGRPAFKDDNSYAVFRGFLAGDVQDGTMDLERFKDERGLVSIKQMRQVCQTDPKYRAEVMRMGPFAQGILLGDGKLVVDLAKDIGKATATETGGPFRSWAARGIGPGK